MPINNLGYRNWPGHFTGSLLRWTSITQAGINIALKSQWIRRLLFFSFFPVIYIGIAFFIFEKMMEESGSPRFTPERIRQMKQAVREGDISEALAPDVGQSVGFVLSSKDDLPEFLRGMPGIDSVVKSLASNDPRAARHAVWCFMVATFFKFQGFLMLIIVGLIVPPLISRDLRSRAILIYFSRPIGRIEYLLGKAAIPAAFLALITAVPAMLLYVFGVMLSPGFFVIADTWDIPFRILLATAALIIPTSLLALMYSSLTHESRFATFAWFATWGLGGGAYLVAVGTLTPDFDFSKVSANWSMLSIYNTVGIVQEWVFGLHEKFATVAPLLSLLVILSMLSFFVLMRRIRAPLQA